MKKEVKIPDIAENVENGLIASILVAEGDEVTEGQALVEVETDKATTEIPADENGTVAEIKVSEGDEVSVNQVIMLLETANGHNGEQKEEKKASEEKKTEQKNEPTAQEASGKEKTEEPDEHEETKQDDKNQAVSPLARKIAREHHVDLSEVQGSGPGNRISRADVEKHAKMHQEESESQTEDSTSEQKETGNAQPMSQIARITAETMQNAWQTIPHVTQFDEANVTELEKFRKMMQEKLSKKEIKVTPTALLLKVAGYALQKFPRFNASLDWEGKAVVYKHNYHIGVAVDTPHGLVVPVVRDVNQKSLAEISQDLANLSEKARQKKLTNDEMQGGTFTISNLGGIGGTGFTPIVYPPQVAILGVARTQPKPVFKNDDIQKAQIMPLSLSYDHRVINGADGARFLSWFCHVLEEPWALLM